MNLDKQIVKMDLKSAAAQTRLKKYLRDQIRSLRQGLRELHEEKLLKWRKAYEAVPREDIREFPWHNASNLIVPVIAIHSDTLLARVMAAVVKVKPPWTTRMYGGIEGGEEIKEAIEEFLQDVGFEPEELDLYRVYHEWFGETVRYGTSVLKCPLVQIYEDDVIPAGDGTGKYDFNRVKKYEGPRPEKLPFNDFYLPPTAKTLESADFKAHRVRLQRHQLEERQYTKVYDRDAVDVVLKNPDRLSPDLIQSEKESDVGARTVEGYGFAEWDIHECHFKYRLERDHFVQCIVNYHERTDTVLRAYFNYYPRDIFVAARLFYRDDFFHGYGFCEMLDQFQEELSQIHNQRRDNMTVANTRVWRVSPDSKLHQGYKIYPSAMLPAEKDEVEPMGHGELGSITIDEERLSLDLAEKRSGVSPPQQGYGSGSFTKRGVYTTMGTLSLLQEGNTRTDLNVTDIRYAHAKLGRLLLSQYALIGMGEERRQAYGKMGELVAQALELFQQKKLKLPIQPATASINREVEKQNDMMLLVRLQQHYSSISQMLTSAADPRMTPDVKEYLTQATKAANNVMKIVLRHFGYDEVERLAPEPKLMGQGVGQPPAAPVGSQGQGAPGEQVGALTIPAGTGASGVTPPGPPGARMMQ